MGVATGAGAIFFRILINYFKHLLFDTVGANLPGGALPLVPAIGGLLVGLLVYYFASEAKGHGVPEVMLAVAMNGGRIRGRVAAIKAVASSICIGSGGSAGREGPIVQIGSALGSSIGQLLCLPEERISLLVVCGAAAGISATFNAPVAGVFFAMEVILSEFASRSFAMVVLSSVTASVVGRAALGNTPAFETPAHSMVHPGELVFYVGLGFITAVVAVLFTRILYWTEDLFDEAKFYEPLKPALGGLMTGLLACYYPQVMGVGYESITDSLNDHTDFQLLAVLVVAKLLATSLTLGSGGSGGVFAPSLFMGSTLGGAYGIWVNSVIPEHSASPGAYALVGMAALFAASSHAPITAILILFELTGDYRIILPLMAATVVSTLVSTLLSRESIYTVKLKRRGIDIQRETPEHANPLMRISVSEVMCRELKTVSTNMTVGELISLFNRTGHHGFPVLTPEGRLHGMVTLKDLEYARIRGEVYDENATVRSIATSQLGYVCPGDSLHYAVRVMGRLGVGRLPVVARSRSSKLVGVLRRNDIIKAYNTALDQGLVEDSFVHRLKVGTLAGARFLEIALPDDSPHNGHRVRDLKLPDNAVLVSVRRHGELLIPRGGTEVLAGDVLVAFSLTEDLPALRSYLMGRNGKSNGGTPKYESEDSPAEQPGCD